MASDKEWIEIVKEINQYKDCIKNSAQKIISSLNSARSLIDVENEFLEILNALGKIGTIASNARKVNDYALSFSDSFTSTRRMRSRGLNKLLIIDLLNQICLISFDVRKRGKKVNITLPKIHLSLFKVG